jgi:hypothetical protein
MNQQRKLPAHFAGGLQLFIAVVLGLSSARLHAALGIPKAPLALPGPIFDLVSSAAATNGDFYVAGDVYEAFPATNAIQPARAGSSDAGVGRFSPERNQWIWATYFGGTGPDYVFGSCTVRLRKD